MCHPECRSLAAYDANCNVADPKRSPHQTYTLGTSADFTIGSLTVTPNVMARYIGAQYSATRNQGYNESVTLDQRGGQAVSGGLTVGAEFGVQELWR